MRYTREPSGNSTAAQLHGLAESLRGERARNQAIADADPLGADEAMLRLPQLNHDADAEGIREALEQLITRAHGLPELNFIDCSAAIRDISMVAASLVRFGIEPVECVPGFSEILLLLSAQVGTPMPRDSFIDYTSRNPWDRRERTFTHLIEERIFINSLRQGMMALNCCLEDIMSAYAYPLSNNEFAAHFRSVIDSFQIMIDSIVQVKKEIMPDVFTHYIRPFFEPFKVGDRAYSAPSGAEMSILNIDQIIWGADCDEELYTTYFHANIIRLPVFYLQISRAFAGQKSLMSILKDHLRLASPPNPAERQSIQALHQFLTKVYSFRMAHYKVAEENVKLRLQETQGDKEVKGSSGFGLLEAKYVLEQTMKSRQITSQALSLWKSGLTMEDALHQHARTEE
jgi:monodechloroaminopyrrolnitrin synthase